MVGFIVAFSSSGASARREVDLRVCPIAVEDPRVMAGSILFARAIRLTYRLCLPDRAGPSKLILIVLQAPAVRKNCCERRQSHAN